MASVLVLDLALRTRRGETGVSESLSNGVAEPEATRVDARELRRSISSSESEITMYVFGMVEQNYTER